MCGTEDLHLRGTFALWGEILMVFVGKEIDIDCGFPEYLGPQLCDGLLPAKGRWLLRLWEGKGCCELLAIPITYALLIFWVNTGCIVPPLNTLVPSGLKEWVEKSSG